MQKTPNLQLNLPEYGDTADITQVNQNFSIIDPLLSTAYDTSKSISNNIGDLSYFTDYNNYHSDLMSLAQNSSDLLSLASYTTELENISELSDSISQLESIASVSDDLEDLADNSSNLVSLSQQYSKIDDLTSTYNTVYSTDPHQTSKQDLQVAWNYNRELAFNDPNNTIITLGYTMSNDETTEEQLLALVNMIPHASQLTDICETVDSNAWAYLEDAYTNDGLVEQGGSALSTLVGYAVYSKVMRLQSYLDIDVPNQHLKANVSDIVLQDGNTWHDNMTSLVDVIDDIYQSSGGTDTSVTQTESTDNANYEVILSGTADDTTRTEGAHKSEFFTFNPSKQSITAGSRLSGVIGNNSMCVGTNNDASGACSVAIGSYAKAESNFGVALGRGSKSRHRSQFVFGEYNIMDNKPGVMIPIDRGNYIEVVGNGTGDNELRSNARTLDWSGNEWLAEGLSVGYPSRTYDSDVADYKVTNVHAELSTNVNYTYTEPGVGDVTYRTSQLTLESDRVFYYQGEPDKFDHYTTILNPMYLSLATDHDSYTPYNATLTAKSLELYSSTTSDYTMTMTSTDLSVTGTTWDGEHESLKDSIKALRTFDMLAFVDIDNITTSAKSMNISSSKRISDYKLLLFRAGHYYNWYNTIIIPTEEFVNTASGTSVRLSVETGSHNEVQVYFKDDTSVYMLGFGSLVDKLTCGIYGLFKRN